MGISSFPTSVGFNPARYNNRGIVDYNATAGNVTLLEITSGGGYIELGYISVNGGSNAEIKITIDDNVFFWGKTGAGSLQCYFNQYNLVTLSDGSPVAKYPDFAGYQIIDFANVTPAEDIIDGSVVTNSNQFFEPIFFKTSLKIEFIRPSSVNGVSRIVYRTP